MVVGCVPEGMDRSSVITENTVNTQVVIKKYSKINVNTFGDRLKDGSEFRTAKKSFHMEAKFVMFHD